jgi:hypothetical protein
MLSPLRATAVAAVLVLGLAGCSSDAADASRPPPSPSATTATPTSAPTAQGRYAAVVLGDRPVGFWPLADAAGARVGDGVLDASPHLADGTVVDGGLRETVGPLGQQAVQFTGAGRVLTPLRGALRPGRKISSRLNGRPDDCTRHWTQVLGTASYGAHGRQGVNVLHYPRFFSTGCHLAVEFWKDDRYQAGCGPGAVSRTGSWLYMALTYDGRTARCYANGRPAGTAVVPAFGVEDDEFGIGGAGSGYAGTLDSGSLADVAVYGTALSATSVLRHAAAAGLSAAPAAAPVRRSPARAGSSRARPSPRR